jgi:hypothetical protein
MVMRGHLRTYESDGNDLTVEWEAILLDDKNNDIGLGGNTSWMANLAVYRDVYVMSLLLVLSLPDTGIAIPFRSRTKP